MAKEHRRYVVGNWKLHPESKKEALAILRGVKPSASSLKHTACVVCPPFVYIDALCSEYRGKKISFGGQNLFSEDSGSFTGEISGTELKDLGCQYVIVGHSERRALGETDKEINKKIQTALRNNLSPIICIGESERDTHGRYLEFITRQLKAIFQNIGPRNAGKIIIAYEPLWAIGRSEDEAIRPHDLHEMMLYIRKVLSALLPKATAEKIIILYGGSVEPANARELFVDGHMNGFLVGHASLSPADFSEILSVVDKA